MQRVLRSPLFWAVLVLVLLLLALRALTGSGDSSTVSQVPSTNETTFIDQNGTSTDLSNEVQATSDPTVENGVIDPGVSPTSTTGTPAATATPLKPTTLMLSSSGAITKEILSYCLENQPATVLRLTMFPAYSGTEYATLVSFFNGSAYIKDTTGGVSLTDEAVLPGQAITWHVAPQYKVLGGAAIIDRDASTTTSTAHANPRPIKAGATKVDPPEGKVVTALTVCVAPE